MEGYIAIIAVSYLLYAILNLFTYPLLFRLGYNKGKFWGFYLPVIFFALFFGSYMSITSLPEYSSLTMDFIMYASENMILVSGGIAVLATLILLISYMISVKLYSNRDF